MDQTIVFMDSQQNVTPMELVWLHGPQKGKRFSIKLGQNIRIGSAYFKLVREGEEIVPVENSRPLLTRPMRWALLGAVFLLLTGALVGILFSRSSRPPVKVSQWSPTADVSRPPSLEIPRVHKRFSRKLPVMSEKRQEAKPPLQNLVKTDELQEQASIAFSSGQFDQASKIWQEILAVDPSNERAREGLKSLQQSLPQGGV